MTRINVVPVEQLCNEHLKAEYRELIRVFRSAKVRDDVPEKYTLGRGHVIFFSNKLTWVLKRYDQLIFEMKKRGFRTTPVIGLRDCDPSLYNDWEPDDEAINLNWQRLRQRYQEMMARRMEKRRNYEIKMTELQRKKYEQNKMDSAGNPTTDETVQS